MKQTIILLLLFSTLLSYAQESPSNWELHASIGQYPASIVVPRFDPIHPGFHVGAMYQWNDHTKHRWVQSGNLGYFFHKSIQGALQLYTEFGYELKLKNGLRIRPLMLGGGYVMAFSDLPSFALNESTGQYETISLPVRHNWLISLGPSFGYQSKLQLAGRPISFVLDYRIQIQGIVIRNTSPVLAYAPLRIGLSLPLTK